MQSAFQNEFFHAGCCLVRLSSRRRCLSRGGAQSMSYALVESIESHGGCVFVRSPVESIVVDGEEAHCRGVRLVDGTVLHSQHVSATGYRRTMSTLVPSDVKKRWGIDESALTIPQAY